MSESKSFYSLMERALKLERAGKKLIKLHIGSAALSIPKVALEAVKNIDGRLLEGYGGAAGNISFRESIARREGCSSDSVVVAPGSKFLIYALLSVLKTSSSRIITPAPFWPAYMLIAQQLGIEFLAVDSTLDSSWSLPNITPKRSDIIILCNPGNPTSCCYLDDDIELLAKRAKDVGATLIIDEAYRDLSFRPAKTHDAIRVRSFSKEFNLGSFRLGYMIADSETVSKIVKFTQITTTCVSAIAQEVGTACLGASTEIITEHKMIWTQRMKLLGDELRRYGFEFAPPQAGMYIFCRHPKIKDSSQFCEQLLDAGVAVAPGGSFGDFRNFIRISASANLDTLRKAAKIIGDLANG